MHQTLCTRTYIVNELQPKNEGGIARKQIWYGMICVRTMITPWSHWIRTAIFILPSTTVAYCSTINSSMKRAEDKTTVAYCSTISSSMKRANDTTTSSE